LNDLNQGSEEYEARGCYVNPLDGWFSHVGWFEIWYSIEEHGDGIINSEKTSPYNAVVAYMKVLHWKYSRRPAKQQRKLSISRSGSGTFAEFRTGNPLNKNLTCSAGEGRKAGGQRQGKKQRYQIQMSAA
jgi:hypothetical protein